MHVAFVCDPPDAVLVSKPCWAADGFRARGHEVRMVHTIDSLRQADAECDLLIFDHKSAGVSRAALARLVHQPRRAVWVQWWRDLVALDANQPLVAQEYIKTFGELMRGMDRVFVKERSLLNEYRSLGIDATWLDQACPAQMPECEYSVSPDWDVLVLGSTGYEQRRRDARALASAGFRVLWAGMAGGDLVPEGVAWHPWLHPLKLPELVSRCGVVLGVDWRSDLPGYTSDRTYLACGMGACYVARYCHCGSEFAPGSYAPQAEVAAWIYENTDELIEIVRRAQADVEERRRRGQWSRRQVMQRHTYAHRADEILQTVMKQRGIKPKATG